MEAIPDKADLPTASIAQEVPDNNPEGTKEAELADALHEESSTEVLSAIPLVDGAVETSSGPSYPLMDTRQEEQIDGMLADKHKPVEDTSVPEIQSPSEVTNPDDRPHEPSSPITASVETGIAAASEAPAAPLQELEPAAPTGPGELDIEGLRERLKLVEQRFAGDVQSIYHAIRHH